MADFGVGWLERHSAATMTMRRFSCGLTVLAAIAPGAASVLFVVSQPDRIVVGSKNFTESLLLGEIIAQQIEAHTNLKVERRFYLAGTYICHQAIVAGRIDMYPGIHGHCADCHSQRKREWRSKRQGFTGE
jgi:glycine betaine/choline ABC-type transport system substrate-binding protein